MNHQKILFKTTLLYVALPTVLFIGGWLKLYFAIPLLCTLGFLIYKEFAFENRVGEAASRFSLKTIFILTAIAGYIAYATGAGGMVPQSFNYVYDNIKLYDLIVHAWPVLYPDKQAFYCYYFGFYLPIATLTKLFGNVNFAEVIFFCWAWMGVTLCVFWVYVLLQIKNSFLVLVFLLAGTLCAITTVFNTLDFKYLRAVEDFSYPYTFLSTWWSNGKMVLDVSTPFHCSLKYASTMTTMAWAPYHYISGILFPALVYDRIINKKTFNGVPLIVGSALIWSPFVVLGLIPIVLLGAWRSFKQIFGYTTFLAVALFIPVLAFYLAHSTSEEMVRGFIWECGKRWWLNYVLFLLIEVGTFALVIFLNRRKHLPADDMQLMLVNLVALLLIPLIYLGFYNDFSNKVGIVPMFFLIISFSKVVCRILEGLFKGGSGRLNFTSALALFVWCCCAITPTNILLVPVAGHPGSSFVTKIAKPFDNDSIKNLSDIPIIGSQFIGDVNAPAIKILFKNTDSTARNQERTNNR